ncbi:MAG: transposase [Muribaculaceae bacterium]|nr:transposase [Muribaculaceae bacterium]
MKNPYHRKSPRASFHDYSHGWFFITICTKAKAHYFGEIVNGNMVLSKIGEFTLQQLQNVSTHYPYAEIFEYVVMPNHIHFMIEIFPEDSTQEPRTHEPYVPTERTALSVVIGGIKRAVTLFGRRNNIPFCWQPRYHDHIIRGINDFNKIGEYIRNNIGEWEQDCFYH